MNSTGNCDFIGRLRERHQTEPVAERNLALFRVQVTYDGDAVRDFLFRTPPTVGQLTKAAGPHAFIIAIERVPAPSASPVAAE